MYKRDKNYTYYKICKEVKSSMYTGLSTNKPDGFNQCSCDMQTQLKKDLKRFNLKAITTNLIYKFMIS